MSAEDTQQAMNAYVEDLLGEGPYKRHFSEEVVVSVVGTDQSAEGPDAAEGLVEYLHKEAFKARPELKSMIVADGQAAAEFDFVGKHVGEFGGIGATGREVRVPYSAVYDLEGEKIRAVRIYLSMDLLMQQLSGAPASEERVGPSV
jgi:predicted ester cyclase